MANTEAEYILSIDPGTVNLGYCVIKISDLHIVEWGAVNIKDSTNQGTCTKLARELNGLNLTSKRKIIIIIAFFTIYIPIFS